MYYLDTNMCIDFMRNRRPQVERQMRKRGPRLVALPAIVVAELWYGVNHSKQVEKNRCILEQFLSPFTIVPFDNQCARTYGVIRAQLASRGKTIGPNDLAIAATALAHEAILVTGNVGEFKRVKGLQIEAWYEVPLD